MFLISPVRAAHVSIYLVLCNALSGLRQRTYYITQGAALGLVCCHPFRAKKNNIRLYGKRILFTGNFGYTQIKWL